jgi:PD-(D/E)XK endonuclease
MRSNTRQTFFRDYTGEVELFLVYCPENNGIYAVPTDEAPSGYGYLRIEPTRNGQVDRIRWARDYELPG